MNTILTSRRSKENHDWAIPILLSFGMHILLASVVIFFPGLFASRPIIPQAYTVNYVSLSSQTPHTVQEQGKPGTSSKKIEPTKQTGKAKSAEIKKEEPISEKTPISIPPALVVTKGSVPPVNADDPKPIKNRIENALLNKPSANRRIHELEEKQKHEQMVEREKQAEQIRLKQVAESIKVEQDAKRAANEALINQKVHELKEKQRHEQMVERERQAEQLRRQQIAESIKVEQDAKRAANEALINQKVHELQEKHRHEQMVERERQAEQIRRQQIAESIKAEQEAKRANEALINQKLHELQEKQKHEQMAVRERQAEQIRRQQIAESIKAEQEAKRANEALINQKLHELQEKQKHEQMAERERQAEQLRRQQIAESVRAQQEAEQAANDATEDLKELLRIPSSTTNGTTGSQKNENKDKETESNQNPVERGYLASISSRIQQFWALPEFAKYDPSLMATIVITINQDGRIISQSFQEHSKNNLFDQYVEKTLQQAAPLPPIPAALKKSQFEIGLVFKPTGLQSKR